MPVLLTELLVAVAFACLLLLACHHLRSQRLRSQKPVAIVTKFADVVAHLSAQESDIRQILLSRAIPNARLIRAFGVTNTFVTDDPDVHRAFTREARTILASAIPNDADWHSFAQLASAMVERYISESLDQSSSDFTMFVRIVTFRIMAVSLFKVEPELLQHHDVDFVTKGINELWALSMTTSTFPPGLLDGINARLKIWLPQYPNPIDFILPTYETMWRLIATSIALLHKDALTRQTLADFRQNPLRRQFAAYPPQGASVESIIKEVMRLHPPTRGLFRAIQVPTLPLLPPPLSRLFTCTVVRAAEIGYLQRDQSIWGPDADVFEPMRHHPKRCTELQQKSMLGFGFGSLKCVASNWAPHAAGVIVAVILERVNDDIQIVEGPMIGAREGWDGWGVIFRGCQKYDEES
ncbi:cytochrome P450 [Cytidiella melzeri]|nr:cytochrome P450 [Cytidiella melzeri]